MNTVKVLTSVFVGATTGALVGYLFASGKGGETAADIGRKAEKFSGEMQRIINDYNSDIKRHIESVKKEAQNMTEN